MSGRRHEAIVIGASAGALEALSLILPALPADFPLPIFVVVHVPPDKRSILSELFRAKCAIDVQEAEDKEPIKAGTAFFAPPGYHLLVEDTNSLSLSTEEPIMFSRPSIDILFETAADVYGSKLIAIVLTGANYDGAAGLRAVVEAGGTGLVQNPREAFASAMPEAAIAACPDVKVMSLAEIAEYLKKV
ncbi:chemotaxis protein CheB [Rhizobium cauense]|uniref:chemotaxis protein CheB n=1 Tax=Rhizobium cauense TaxID=1166683 RepID=UPI001C6E63B9|nr:chemotaxis protein CheB [Rhizobium cauense]MBW9114820.1 chemotaxis protein CheB [Rhizobium cauense]